MHYLRVRVDQFRSRWEDIHSSLWFIPSLMVLAAIAFSIALPQIDHHVSSSLTRHQAWIFSGSAESARTLLSVIAASLITVISLLFSITILTVQQASTQYTPRVVRTFTRDRPSQFVLGIYLATFTYALLVLLQVRGDNAFGGSSIPTLSVTVAIVLAIVCLGALVYFIHHSTTLFQASTIIERVHHELLNSFVHLYPASIGEPHTEAVDSLEQFRRSYAHGPSIRVCAANAGFLRVVNVEALVQVVPDDAWGIVLPQVGDYVLRGSPLVEMGGADPTDEQLADQIRAAFILDSTRSLLQDSLFGVRQLVDIALKALSPSIHDPTTAEHAISALGDALIALALREFPERTRLITTGDPPQRAALWVNRPTYEDYVLAAFEQVRRVSEGNVHVTTYLLNVLGTIARAVQPEQADAIAREIGRTSRRIGLLELDPDDSVLLQQAMQAATSALSMPRTATT